MMEFITETDCVYHAVRNECLNIAQINSCL